MKPEKTNPKGGSSCKTVPVAFPSDHLQIRGMLHLPHTPNPPVVIGSHGFLSDGNSSKQIALARLCNENGMAYFRFHHRGCGNSEGVFRDVTTLSGRVSDLVAAVSCIRSRPDTGEDVALFGSSMGGATAISAFAATGARSIVTLAAPIRGNMIVRPPDDINPHDLPEEFYEKNLTFDTARHLPGLHHILVIHGTKDAVVPVESAYQLFEAAESPKEIKLFSGGDHQISDPVHQNEFIRITMEWFSKTLLGNAEN